MIFNPEWGWKRLNGLLVVISDNDPGGVTHLHVEFAVAHPLKKIQQILRGLHRRIVHR